MNLKKISQTKLTRKEFLTYLGVLLLSIFGISSFLKNNSKQTTSFGSGPYGV